MTTVFVYEYVTAIGARGDEPLAPSLLAEGRAMRDAVVADFAAIPDVLVMTLAAEDEVRFREIAAASDYALIIAPETAGILEQRCRWALEAGAQLLGPSLDAIRLTTDKLALAEHFEREGIRHPRTWPLGNEPTALCPIVWKPRDGAGSQVTFLLKDATEHGRLHDEATLAPLGARSASKGEPAPLLALRAPKTLCESACMIAQEYVPGIAASVSFLIGREWIVALAPCRQHISDDDRLRYLGGSLPMPIGLANRATKLAERAIESVPGLFGYIGIDLVLGSDSANDCLIEINPRLTTSYIGLRQAAEFNIAEALLDVVRSKTPRRLSWRSTNVAWLGDGRIQINR